MQRQQIPEDTKAIHELVTCIKACDQQMLALQSQDPEKRSAEWRLLDEQRTQLVKKMRVLTDNLVYVSFEVMRLMK